LDVTVVWRQLKDCLNLSLVLAFCIKEDAEDWDVGTKCMFVEQMLDHGREARQCKSGRKVVTRAGWLEL